MTRTYIEIPLEGSHLVAKIDKKYEQRIRAFDWKLSPGNYAWANKPDGGMVMMHKLIWHLSGRIIPEGHVVDHVNHERLDNRLRHLRCLTVQLNNVNKEIDSRNTSGYKGVHWDASHGMWRAQITYMKKAHHAGYYTTAEEAALAYNIAAEAFYGAHIPVFNAVTLERPIRIPETASQFTGIAYYVSDAQQSGADLIVNTLTMGRQPLIANKIFDRFSGCLCTWVYTTYAEAAQVSPNVVSKPLFGAHLLARLDNSFLVCME